jgi:Ca2+-binding RTX toxin-like protein
LSGGTGNDSLWGSYGHDKLTGGTGKDAFVFWEYGPAYSDHIVDFKHGEDKIHLTDDPFLALAVGTLHSGNFRVGTKAKDGNDHIIYDQKTGKLYYDEDGQGGIDQMVIAILDNKPTLTAGDIKVTAYQGFDDYWIV